LLIWYSEYSAILSKIHSYRPLFQQFCPLRDCIGIYRGFEQKQITCLTEYGFNREISQHLATLIFTHLHFVSGRMQPFVCVVLWIALGWHITSGICICIPGPGQVLLVVSSNVGGEARWKLVLFKGRNTLL